MSKPRSSIEAQYKWNLELICKDLTEFQKREAAVRESFSDISCLSGTLESPENLFKCLSRYHEINEEINRLYVYSYMKHTQDTTVPENQALYSSAVSLNAEFEAVAAFINPQIIEIGPDTIVDFMLDNPELKLYEHYLMDIFRKETHTLSTEAEVVIATLSESLSASNDIFTILTNADFDFGKVKDENGKDVTLTHATYRVLQLSKDRDVRKNSFEAYFAKFQEHKNTLAASLVRKSIV